MKLHQNIELFQDAVLSASQRFSIPEIYVEKDYWVTLVLCEIFHSEIADQVVFKGGTSLSKCHKLIQRFSEDIDLVVLRNEGENDNQLKRKIRTISKIVENAVPEIQVEGLTNKKGNIKCGTFVQNVHCPNVPHYIYFGFNNFGSRMVFRISMLVL